MRFETQRLWNWFSFFGQPITPAILSCPMSWGKIIAERSSLINHHSFFQYLHHVHAFHFLKNSVYMPCEGGKRFMSFAFSNTLLPNRNFIQTTCFPTALSWPLRVLITAVCGLIFLHVRTFRVFFLLINLQLLHRHLLVENHAVQHDCHPLIVQNQAVYLLLLPSFTNPQNL